MTLGERLTRRSAIGIIDDVWIASVQVPLHVGETLEDANGMLS